MGFLPLARRDADGASKNGELIEKEQWITLNKGLTARLNGIRNEKRLLEGVLVQDCQSSRFLICLL